MMKNYKRLYLLLFVGLSVVSTAMGQYTLTLRIQQQPANHSVESIFAAGNFNQWQPADSNFRFIQSGGHLILTIKTSSANVTEFKCTRGNWQKTACNSSGADEKNHAIVVTQDTVIDIKINAWKDDFTVTEKQHTISKNVQVIDTAFAIPQLNTTRKIWIYLPPDYAGSNAKYPVMYLQDGQNIFDEYTSGYGEWGVDEILDSMIKEGSPPCIVVGIDNGAERMQEYNPYDVEKFGKGKGDGYLSFLKETLKPFIDRHYRTLSSKKNTIIGGSSMGGLISFYAMLKYPETFGNAGIFSPSFWIADGIKKMTDSTAGKLDGKLFFYMGGLEGPANLADMNEVVEKAGKKSNAMIYSIVDPEGQHNERAWHKWFAAFYKWLMSDGFNQPLELEK